MRQAIFAVAALALVSVVGWFAYQNTGRIPEIDLLIARPTQVPLWMALFSSAIVGAALVVGFLSWPLLRMRLRVRRQERSIGELEQELHGLRTLPLSEETPERQAQES